MITAMRTSRHTRASLPLAAGLMLLFLSGCDLFGTPVDSRTPRLEIVAPYAEATVAGESLLISVDAEALGEGNWISFVSITINGVQAGATELEGDLYNLRLNTTDFEDGTYRLEATGFDRYQSRGLSAPVLISIDNAPATPGPRSRITDPADQQEVMGVVRVFAQAEPGEEAVSRMDLLIDGTPVASEVEPVSEGIFLFDLDTAELGLGEHTLAVKAFSAPDAFHLSEPVTIMVLENDEASEGSPGSLRWKTPGISGDVNGAVAVGFNNDIYIGSSNNFLYAFSANGALTWRYEAGAAIDSSPLVGNNDDVFITGSDGRLYGINAEGERRWGWGSHYDTGSSIQSSPALGTDGTIYFGDSSGKLHAVSAFDGLAQTTGSWPVDVTNAEIVTPPVISQDRTIYVGATDGHLYAYDPEGRRLWKSGTSIGSVMVGMAMVEREYSVVLPSGTVRTTIVVVLYVVSNDGQLVAVSGEDGSVLWSYPLSGPMRSAPVVGPDGTIYVGTSTGLMALNADVDALTPRLRFVHVAPDVGTPVIDSNGIIYFMSDKTLMAINAGNAPQWHYFIGVDADGPLTITRDGALLVAPENGYLYAFETGSVGLNPENWPTFQRNARNTGRLGIDATDG